MPYHSLSLRFETHLAILTLNRPDKRNAISPEIIEELLAALDEIDRSPARVAILTGAGKAFCAGMDLESLQAMTTRSAEAGPPEEAGSEGVLDVAVRVLKGETKAQAEETRAANANTASARTTPAPAENDLES